MKRKVSRTKPKHVEPVMPVSNLDVRCPLCHKPMQINHVLPGVLRQYVCGCQGSVHFHNVHEGDKTRR